MNMNGKEAQDKIVEAIRNAIGGQLGDNVDIKVVKVDSLEEMLKSEARASRTGCTCGHCGTTSEADPLDELMAQIKGGPDEKKKVLQDIQSKIKLSEELDKLMSNTNSSIFDIVSVLYSMVASMNYVDGVAKTGVSHRKYSMHLEKLAQDITNAWITQGNVKPYDVDDIFAALILAGLRLTDAADNFAEELNKKASVNSDNSTPLAKKIADLLKDL